jgi:hypothetical protein
LGRRIDQNVVVTLSLGAKRSGNNSTTDRLVRWAPRRSTRKDASAMKFSGSSRRSARRSISLLFGLLCGALLSSFSPSAIGQNPDKQTPEKSADAKQEKYLLQYKFTPGEIIRTRVLHNSSIRTTIKKDTETAASRAESVKSWKVHKVDDQGRASIEYQVDYVSMQSKIGEQAEVRYDSRIDTVVPINYKGIADTVGIPLSIITLSQRGMVLKRERLIADQKEEQGSNAEVTVPLPEGPVAVGETWGDQFTIPVILTGGAVRKINARHHYALSAVDGGVARIKMETQILDPALPPEVKAQLLQKTSSGEVFFNIERGRVIRQNMVVDGKVIDFHGNGSMMTCRVEFSEELIEESEKTADQSTAPAKTEETTDKK